MAARSAVVSGGSWAITLPKVPLRRSRISACAGVREFIMVVRALPSEWVCRLYHAKGSSQPDGKEWLRLRIALNAQYVENRHSVDRSSPIQNISELHDLMRLRFIQAGVWARCYAACFVLLSLAVIAEPIMADDALPEREVVETRLAELRPEEG